jgi:ferredoxin--NADP+ reductase
VLKDESDALQNGIEDHAAEIFELVQDPKTHVYLAGMKKIATAFDNSMARLAGSDAAWNTIKLGLIEDKRWSELTYI